MTTTVFEVQASEVEFKMASRDNYVLDIGGSIGLKNGQWYVREFKVKRFKLKVSERYKYTDRHLMDRDGNYIDL